MQQPAHHLRWTVAFLLVLGVLVGCRVYRPASQFAVRRATYPLPSQTVVVSPPPPVQIAGGPRLNHALHADNGMECTDCHQIDEETGKVIYPDFETCWDCHEDMEEEAPPEKRVTGNFFDADQQPLWKSALTRYDEKIVFSHPVHVAKELPCSACHGDMATVEGGRPAKPVMGMDACMQCHTESQAPNECQICHPLIGPDHAPRSHADGLLWRLQHGAVSRVGRAYETQNECSLCHKEPNDCMACHMATPPASHAMRWQERHGLSVQGLGGGFPERCALCHTGSRWCDDCHQVTKPQSHKQLWNLRHGQIVRAAGGYLPEECAFCHKTRSFCDRCHLDEAPRSHTNLFSTRTHGVLASIDRRSCQTCHRTDFCVRCHEDTPPRSHRGQWAAGRNTHCVQCHFPVTQAQSCRACHRTHPTHSSAPPQPAGHIPGRNCRLCHNALGGGAAPPLRHLDNGLNCELCHQ